MIKLNPINKKRQRDQEVDVTLQPQILSASIDSHVGEQHILKNSIDFKDF